MIQLILVQLRDAWAGKEAVVWDWWRKLIELLSLGHLRSGGSWNMFEVFADNFDTVWLLCGDNDGSGESEESPEESDEAVGEEPG